MNIDIKNNIFVGDCNKWEAMEAICFHIFVLSSRKPIKVKMEECEAIKIGDFAHIHEGCRELTVLSNLIICLW